MQWFQKAIEWCDAFFNKPLPIVGISLVVILVFTWKIFISTSYGKKKYNDLKLRVEKAEFFTSEVKKACFNIVQECKEECDKKVVAIEAYYETKLAQSQAKKDALEEFTLKVCDEIHNEKIKRLVVEYRDKTDGYQTIMTDKLNQAKFEATQEFEKRIRALEEKLYEKAENNETKEEII